MQAELQTALFQAFDALNLQRVKNVQRSTGHIMRTGSAQYLRTGSANARTDAYVRHG